MADDGEEEGSYNDTNRAFLQAFMARSTLTFKEAQPVLAAIFTAYEGREILPGDVTEADFSAYISSANAAISPFDLEIRSSAHQETGERIYGLINSTSDAMTQLATPFTPDEISFVKRVLDAIFETNNTSRHEILAIQPKQATRLAKAQSNRRESEGAAETQGSTGQGITQLQADKVLKSLVEQGWFEKSRKNYYSLTPRALMELRGWLMETYNEDDESEGEGSESRPLKVKLCYACKEIITYGQRCPKRSCQCRLHDFCTRKIFHVQKARKCPICKTDWTGEDYVGERAAIDKSRHQTHERPRRALAPEDEAEASINGVEDGAAEDEDEDDD